MTWVYLESDKDKFLNATPASKIEGKQAHQQETATSCWANCIKHVVNYYRSRKADQTRFTEDHDIEVNIDLTKVASITAILEKLGHENNIDGNRIPTEKEIHDEISAGSPLIINVGPAAATSDGSNATAKGGHWMVIVGSNVADGKILVFDPDDGDMHEYTWDSKTPSSSKYKGWFWQNTSYVTK